MALKIFETTRAKHGGITPVSFIRLAAQSLHRLHRHRDDYLEIKQTLSNKIQPYDLSLFPALFLVTIELLDIKIT